MAVSNYSLCMNYVKPESMLQRSTNDVAPTYRGTRSGRSERRLRGAAGLLAGDLGEDPVAEGTDLRHVAPGRGIDQPVGMAVVPNGTFIPVRGHFLIARNPDAANVTNTHPFSRLDTRDRQKLAEGRWDTALTPQDRLTLGFAWRKEDQDLRGDLRTLDPLAILLQSGKGTGLAASFGLSIGVKSASSSLCASRPGHLPPPDRMARSTSSRAKSVRRLDVSSRTASAGCASWNEPRCCASQFEAKVSTVVTHNRPSAPPRAAA